MEAELAALKQQSGQQRRTGAWWCSGVTCVAGSGCWSLSNRAAALEQQTGAQGRCVGLAGGGRGAGGRVGQPAIALHAHCPHLMQGCGHAT